MVRAVTALVFCFVFCFAAGVIEPARAADPAANVDAARLDRADQDPANWMTYGRTYSEQRFSPLAQITADNVNLLGIAWYADLDSTVLLRRFEPMASWQRIHRRFSVGRFRNLTSSALPISDWWARSAKATE